jgi:hypothetical protein
MRRKWPLKNHLPIPFALVLLLGMGSPGRAQSFYGATGLFVHPSALPAQRGALNLNVTVLTQKLGNDIDTYVPSSLSYALTGRAEIGALYVRHTGPERHPHGHVGGFTKYQFVPDAPGHPAVALTGSFRNGDALEWLFEGVVSHSFQRNSRTLVIAHTGVKWGRSNAHLDHQTDVAGFVGLELPLVQRLRLVGETSTRFDFEPAAASSIGLMWNAPNGSHVGLGFVNIGRSDNVRFFFGVGYPIGGER